MKLFYTPNRKLISLSGMMLMFCMTLMSSSVQGQENTTGRPKTNHFLFAADLHHLRSTHSQTLYGGSLFVGKRIRNSLAAGIGCEVTYTDSLHTHDKTTNVYSFRPVPVFGEVRYSPSWKRWIVPFAHLAFGVSFIHYQREHVDPVSGPAPRQPVDQKGFYASGGFGFLFPMGKHLAPSLGVSLKGFHISGNPYEINPHGVTLRAGLVCKW